jgi:hypothetical protein
MYSVLGCIHPYVCQISMEPMLVPDRFEIAFRLMVRIASKQAS